MANGASSAGSRAYSLSAGPAMPPMAPPTQMTAPEPPSTGCNTAWMFPRLVSIWSRIAPGSSACAAATCRMCRSISPGGPEPGSGSSSNGSSHMFPGIPASIEARDERRETRDESPAWRHARRAANAERPSIASIGRATNWSPLVFRLSSLVSPASATIVLMQEVADTGATSCAG